MKGEDAARLCNDLCAGLEEVGYSGRQHKYDAFHGVMLTYWMIEHNWDEL